MKSRNTNYFRQSDSIALKEYNLFGRINIVVQNELPKNIALTKVLKKVAQVIPDYFLEDLDAIYIGEFDFLIEKGLESLYEDGTIYISSIQENVDDMFTDMIHEIAHCVEQTYGNDLYSDGLMEEEFLRKRKRLLDILKSQGYSGISDKEYFNPEYSEEFDEFLYMLVGYPVLTNLTGNLFVSPYGATSLREYFANCFEEYFGRSNFKFVKSISPAVLDKIEMLLGK